MAQPAPPAGKTDCIAVQCALLTLQALSRLMKAPHLHLSSARAFTWLELLAGGIRVSKATDGASQQGIEPTSSTEVRKPGPNGRFGDAQDREVQECDVCYQGTEEEGS